MYPFSLLLKPASASCNLRCTYCFYLKYLQEHSTRMELPLLENIIKSYLEVPMSHYDVLCQGGEPTLMGLEFFEKLIEYEQQYARPNAIIANAVQTNGTLLTPEMAQLFHQYNFLLGISIDGPEHCHNKYRHTIGGKGTFSEVMKGLDILFTSEVNTNVLCVVNNYNVKFAKDIYLFFKEIGFKYIQFIPCVEWDSKGNLQEYSVQSKDWGLFLSEVFDLWYPSDVEEISIRNFDNFLSLLYERPAMVCENCASCNFMFVVEYDGTVYPCDFFTEKHYKLGNIKDHPWEYFCSHTKNRSFGKQKKTEVCRQCPYVSLCLGGCPKYYGDDSKTYLCEGLKIFYPHAIAKVKQYLNLQP